MNLSYAPGLPVHLLAACFNKTSATYKFYWFLAVLGRVEQGQTQISKQDLFSEMVAHSWFTVNYFHVSFGKQDKLQQAIERIKLEENLTIDADRNAINKKLQATTNKNTLKALLYFNSEVPHRFLSPWFRAEDMNAAYANSQQYQNNCPYALYKDYIEINPAWMKYLQRNARVLKDFCYWNLSIYLQSKNPNVPDIPGKLYKSPIRKALTVQRKQYWDIVLNELGSVDCIYTNKKLLINQYAVEHFIPYAFVAHDLIWNLIPADPTFNCTKSDKLPDLEKYFQPFYQLQQQAVEIIRDKQPNNKLLEDYLSIFPNLETLNAEHYKNQLQPLITIASNNGFEYL